MDENRYRNTEQWLYKLDALKQRVKNLRNEKTEIEESIDGNMGIDYSKDKLAQTYKFSSTTEDAALRLAEISREIQICENRIIKLENSLSILNQNELSIVQMKYLQNQPWYNISYELKYSERHCKRIRNNAIEKISIAVFGE